jgi:hypothetical protein
MGEACSMNGRDEECVCNLMGIYEDERVLGMLRYRGEDKIKINLKEVGYEGMNWIYLALHNQWRVVLNTAMNFPCSVKDGELFEHLREYSLLKKVSAL